MISNRSVPEAAVIPELPYPDVREAADWLSRAFGFRERLQIGDHRAQLVFENGAVIAIQGDASGSTLLVRVEDADAHHAEQRAPAPRSSASPRTTRTASGSTAPWIPAGTAGRSPSRSPTSTLPTGAER